MGSGMSDHLTAPPEPQPGSPRPLPGIGRVLLGLFLGMLRFLLVMVLDLLIIAARLILWPRRVLSWLGWLVLVSSALDYAMTRHLLVPVFSVGCGVGLIAASRASLLLNDRLRFWQLQLHAWAQGWPVTRYAFTVLPPRR